MTKRLLFVKVLRNLYNKNVIKRQISSFLLFFLFRPEIVHVWKDSRLSNGGPAHSAQMVIDGVSYLTETVYSISAQPSKALTDWVADKIAPTYWKQNTEIIVSIFVNGN